MTESARSTVMLEGEMSKYVDTIQGVAQGCTLSPKLFKICINDLIVAVEAARQVIMVGEDTVSARCLRMTSWGYQKHLKDSRNKERRR